jgi:hypothetical protein
MSVVVRSSLHLQRTDGGGAFACRFVATTRFVFPMPSWWRTRFFLAHLRTPLNRPLFDKASQFMYEHLAALYCRLPSLAV